MPVQKSGMTTLMKSWLFCFVLVQLAMNKATAGETCRFSGTTDADGRLAIAASSSANADGTTTVDVIGRFTANPMPFVHITYLMQEISTWRSDRLDGLAVSTRYMAGSRVVRQQWDVFRRGRDGLEAYRLQGSPDELQRAHAPFVRHWDPATFGQPWLQDYWAASPERRRDLDMPAASLRSPLRSPLALAFYWSRRMPRTGQSVAVFLPGFKRDKSVDLTISPVGSPGNGWQMWQSAVRYPALSMSRDSIASAWISNDGHLLQLALEVQWQGSTARGLIRQDGCSTTLDRR
jgi:hypothetical protein